MTMADHIMVLHNTEVQQIGTPAEIYKTPANEFVASFFGVPPINILPATKLSSKSLKVNGDFEVKVDQVITENELKVGIRPNELRVAKADELTANATVKNIEFLGDEKILYATFNNGNEVSAIISSETHFDLFDTIKITSTNNVLLFSQDGINITKGVGDVVNA